MAQHVCGSVIAAAAHPPRRSRAAYQAWSILVPQRPQWTEASAQAARCGRDLGERREVWMCGRAGELKTYSVSSWAGRGDGGNASGRALRPDLLIAGGHWQL